MTNPNRHGAKTPDRGERASRFRASIVNIQDASDRPTPRTTQTHEDIGRKDASNRPKESTKPPISPIDGRKPASGTEHRRRIKSPPRGAQGRTSNPTTTHRSRKKPIKAT